ncbi:RICIN domain-containing protein [Cellulomonas palmilytica]|uniref:RICIN domain-containing protein n=1 Tax=Cellulomonas palmilytica TaxID=2608402 RepID=UPI001F2C0FBB|nr:RICIN domain-containing protein [Cellulomonas palmilytica]
MQYASLRHAADVRVEQCREGAHQQWRVVPVGYGYYQVRARHSDMCLDVYDRRWENWTNVIQGVCQDPYLSTSFNQHWRLVGVDGHYELTPRHATGMCLNKHYNDAIIYQCNHAPWQQWRFERVPT